MPKKLKLPEVSRDRRSKAQENDPRIRIIAMRHERAKIANFSTAQVVQLANMMGMNVYVLCATAGAFRPVFDPNQDRYRLIFDKEMVDTAIESNEWPTLLVVQFLRMEAGLRAVAKLPGATLLSTAERILSREIANPQNG